MTGYASLLLSIVAILQIACQSSTNELNPSLNSNSSSSVPISYPDIDSFLGEQLHENEESIAHSIAGVIEKAITEASKTRGKAVRDAHPKAHGCVKARFHVDVTLPANLAKGIFQPGHRYDAFVRFSNSNGDPNHADIIGDGRGMTVKLLGVPGKKLLEIESEAVTQDFIMISHPVFIMDNPADYLTLVKETNSHNWFMKMLTAFTLGPQGFTNFRAMTAKQIANPLQERYWSMVPYQLGTGPERQAMKFSAKPFVDSALACPQLQDKLPLQPIDNYLRQTLRKTLEHGKACMQFLVQPRTPSMSVEDSRTEWKESEAPFIKVAVIEIPQQEFDTPEQNLFCENLSYNPWHSLPDHRPLGAVNRLRKVIYPQISEARHKLNAATRAEPQTTDPYH
jgi:hypothetical protein